MTMHQAKQLVFTLSTLLLSATLSSASGISSCLEAECPIQDGTISANCQVANQTLSVIGISSLSVPIPGQDEDLELAWTVGAQSYDGIDPKNGTARYIERVYYLGTPPSVDLKADDLAYGGCAFYLTGSENESLFHKSSTGSTSYCREFLSRECVSSLNTKLSSLAEEHTLGSSESRICPKIASGLQSDIPSSCDSLDDAVVRGVALTGPTAAEPLSDSKNSSSNCYPTLPKTNDLTRQFSYNISATMDIGDTAPAVEGETPILSMFWSSKGDKESKIENAAVQLSCLRPIDKTTASDDTMVKDGGDDTNGAISMNGGSNILSATAIASVAILFFWLI